MGAPKGNKFSTGRKKGGKNEKTQQWETCKDQHRTHTADIRIHPLLINKVSWQITTTDTQDGNNRIKGENQSNTHA